MKTKREHRKGRGRRVRARQASAEKWTFKLHIDTDGSFVLTDVDAAGNRFEVYRERIRLETPQ